MRDCLDERGVLTAAALQTAESGAAWRSLGSSSSAPSARETATVAWHGVRGVLERSPEGVANLLADAFEPLEVAGRTVARDFHWNRQVGFQSHMLCTGAEDCSIYPK